MARHIRLADLVPPEDDRDTIEIEDVVYFLPQLGIDEMARLLDMQENVSAADTFDALRETKKRLLNMLRTANPGKDIPEFDFTVTQMMDLIAIFSGAEGGAVEVVREALASEATGGAEPTDEDAAGAAKDLGEAAGTRSEDDDDPLASAKPSRKRSSRSGTSATGGRNGGQGSAGRSSSRTSKKRSASKTG